MDKKNFYNLMQKSGGFSLLEVLIAIFVLVIGVVGTYTAFGGMLASSSTTKQKLTAAYLAQEGIEIVRNVRDTNWLQNESGGTDGWAPTLQYFTTAPHNCEGASDGNPYTGFNGGCEADYLTGTQYENTGAGHTLNQISGSLNNRPVLAIDSDSNNNSYMYNAPLGSPLSVFRRQIIVNPINVNGRQDALDVIVNVYWQEKGKNYNFPVEAILYNWWSPE
jgi:prepilin-type N-terminal cleavage/methylation domain-containing protein